MKRTRTPLIPQKDIARNWHLVDARELTFGRLSTKIAGLLMGKHKPTYSPHQDQGDFVVVIHANKLKITGNKADAKEYHRHSWYPGSIKTRTFAERKNEDVSSLLQDSVRRMLPKNSLSNDRLKRLRIFEGPEHTYENHFNSKK